MYAACFVGQEGSWAEFKQGLHNMIYLRQSAPSANLSETPCPSDGNGLLTGDAARMELRHESAEGRFFVARRRVQRMRGV
ncbi:MAG: hypothetical protein ORN49_06220 [Rhodobacteraceae bacterium]|nr:hypothetical protein [Paracoccaceae bacterium]